MYYVYYLIDPRDNVVFYVGKGTKGRMNYHENYVKSGKPIKSSRPKFNKIKEILDAGYEVIKLKVFETDDELLAYTTEIEHINAIGIENLTNIATDRKEVSISKLVSDGLRNSKKYAAFVDYLRSDEGKEHCRIKNLGPRNPMYGKKLSPEHKKALHEGASRPSTEEHKKNISKALKGIKRTEEFKNKVSESLRKSEAFRKVMSSAEYKEKQRINSSGQNNPNANTYEVISPAGNVHIVKGGLRKFCKENGLSIAIMSAMANGKDKRSDHNGWTIIQLKK